MYVTGMYAVTDSNLASTTIAHGSTVDLTYNLDITQATRVGGAEFAPLLLSKGVAYDILHKAGANDTFGTTFTMGNSPPAEVQLTRSVMTYVDGSALGSLTEASTTIYFMNLEIGSNPAISGGGTDLLGVTQ
jgi:hypothetical protein